MTVVLRNVDECSRFPACGFPACGFPAYGFPACGFLAGCLRSICHEESTRLSTLKIDIEERAMLLELADLEHLHVEPNSDQNYCSQHRYTATVNIFTIQLRTL